MHGQRGRPQHEVDVELEVPGATLGADVGEPPLAAGVIGRCAPDGQALARADGLHGLVHLGTLGEHRLAGGRAEVVEVDVHREARHIEVEQVERGAAFEGDAPLQRPRPLANCNLNDGI